MSTTAESGGSKGYLENKQFEPRELDFIFDSLMRCAAHWKDWGTLEQYKIWHLLKKVDGMRAGSFSPAFRNGDHPKVVSATTREAGW
jgi:hypothetical protein